MTVENACDRKLEAIFSISASCLLRYVVLSFAEQQTTSEHKNTQQNAWHKQKKYENEHELVLLLILSTPFNHRTNNKALCSHNFSDEIETRRGSMADGTVTILLIFSFNSMRDDEGNNNHNNDSFLIKWDGSSLLALRYWAR